MATYIQGLVGYVPQVQPFKPNLGFYNQVLQFKQNQYDTNYNKVNSLYGSLLNSPLSREDNIEKRDTFFTEIKDQIHKISRMDLSLQQNVQAASKVFNGLLDDKGIQKDMIWTKNFHNEMERAENFKLCTDGDDCGGKYWEEGIMDMQQQYRAFVEASEEEALNFSNVTYTPGQDLLGDAMKWVKEMDISITREDLDPSGRYIITTKNGEITQDYFNQMLMGKFGNDQKYMDAYRVKERVNAKNQIYGMVDNGMFESYQEAESYYIQEQSDFINEQVKAIQKEVRKMEEDLGIAKNQKEILEKKAENEGTYEGSYLQREIERYSNKESDLESSLEYGRRAKDDTERYFNTPNSLEGLINVMANSAFTQEMQSAAQITSLMNSEVKVREDKFALEQQSFRNAMALEGARHRYKLIELGEKHGYALELENFKHQLENGGNENGNPFTFGAGEGSASEWTFSEDRERIESDILSSINDNVGHLVGTIGSAMVDDIINNQGSLESIKDYEGLMDAIIQKMDDEQINTDNRQLNEYRAAKGNQQKMRAFMSNPNNRVSDIVNNADLTNRGSLELYNEYIKPKILDKPKSQRNTGYLENITTDSYINQITSDLTARKDAFDQHIESVMRIEEDAINKAASYTPSVKEMYDNKKKVEAMSKSEYFKFLNKDGVPQGFNSRAEFLFKTSYWADYHNDPNKENEMFREFTDIIYNNRSDTKGMKDALKEMNSKYRDTSISDSFKRKADMINPDKFIAGIGEWIAKGYFRAGQYASNVLLERDAGNGTEFLTKELTGNYLTNEQMNDIITEYGETEYKNNLYHYAGGFSSIESQAMKVNLADAKNKSIENDYLLSFGQNLLSANKGDYSIDWGTVSDTKFGDNNKEADLYFRQILADFQGREEGSGRAKVSMSYQDVAGSNDVTSLTIRQLNPSYTKANVGSEDEKGLTSGREFGESVTVYIKKDVADNLFRKSYNNSPMESMLNYSKSYEFRNYEDLTPPDGGPITINQDPNRPGHYYVRGHMAVDFRNGKRVYRDISTQSVSTNPDELKANLEQALRDARTRLKQLESNN